MRYAFDFFFDNGKTEHCECDRYVIQNGAIILERQKEYDGQVLRTDEKFTVGRVVVFNHLLYFLVEEREMQHA